MKNKVNINYLFRKRLPQYNSIEELFVPIINEVSVVNTTSTSELLNSGGSPFIIFQNLIRFRREKSTLYHITGDIHYMALVTGKQSVLTIHDVGSIIKGNIIRKLYIKLFWFWLPSIFVKRITVISEFSKTQLLEIVPSAKNIITVIYNPVSPLLQPLPKKFNKEIPTILHLGTKENKNLENTILGLIDISCNLIIVGKLNQPQIKCLQENKISYKNYVGIPYAKIKELYETCDIVSFISKYEGFGMPIIEAQKVGRTVITSNRASIPEVAGNGAHFVDPENINEINEGFLKLIHDSDYRNSLIENGFSNVKRFELTKIVTEYKQLYKELEK